ncbi:hypothetical protein F2P56_004582 [Juglans regia]|uniref:Uncharacterized protein n=1 Tax=Juglans regia TaxID=51240 RepID=A0A833Y7C3_JUGRE|nr:hypothetical protein F2P56_004582 [Juglans regia]
MGRVVLYIQFLEGNYALYSHRSDRHGLVVFEALFAGQGEEGLDDCDPASGRGEHCSSRYRRERAVRAGLGHLEAGVLAGRCGLLLRGVVPYRVVDQEPARGGEDRRQGGG